MGIRNTTILITDMTCSACEARITRTLESMNGVVAVKVSLRGGRAVLEYDDEKTSLEAIKAAIEKIGYTVGNNNNKSTTIAIGIGILLAALYMLANAAGLFNSIPSINASIGYGMLFVVGVLTSVHCIAMCGGIALSQSVANLGSAKPSAEMLKKATPGILYNGGRVVSYTLIGGIVGALGAAFSFSPMVKGLISAAAGFFMIFLGLKMLGLLSGLPKISSVRFAPLQRAVDRFSTSMKKRGPFAVGLLNGLMPCGPLQTMQLYALGTGSFFAGALSMFIFSMGTVPLMLGFGLAAAFIPKKFIPVMVKASAVLVMFLGMITLSRAAALSGIALPEFPALRAGLSQISAGIFGNPPDDWSETRTAGGPVKATIQDNVQTVLTDFGDSGYYMPLVVQVGIPVKWTIRVTEDGLNGCNNPVTIPAYKIRKTLVPGDNIIEFTPRQTGTIPYTCWMGMISSRITVVGDLADTEAILKTDAKTPAQLLAIGRNGTSGAVLGGGCCSGVPSPDSL